MNIKILESKLLYFCKNSKSFTLFHGSGFSVFGELFKEYILLSINSDKISINLKLCDKIDKKLSDFEIFK